MKCGLLGRKLGHSYSPQIHGMLADYTYTLFEREPDDLEFFLRHEDFAGLNITVPYKKAVIPFLDELTPIAKRLGAVNTIVKRNGKLIGHNTDYFGFLTMVKQSGLKIAGTKALILGSGGASNTAAAVLRELGAKVIIVSRCGENNYQNLHLHQDAEIIVNTTPVGMFPEVGVSPVNLDLFPHLTGVLDVIYNPSRTQILLDAQRKGITAVNGLLMLVAQAKEAAEWFLSTPINDDVISQIHHNLRCKMENIILIGMPGCGKSTVGTALASQLNMTFVDADAVLAQKDGRSIPEIFAADGEEYFRKLETETLSDLGKQSGLVIATGGGCVTQKRNYCLLHQNGTLFYLTRELSKLPTEGRPLSQNTNLLDMYHIRGPLYESFADYTISNDGSLESTIHQILSKLEKHT